MIISNASLKDSKLDSNSTICIMLNVVEKREASRNRSTSGRESTVGSRMPGRWQSCAHNGPRQSEVTFSADSMSAHFLPAQ